jgi:VIT1/CCC1 family predicted Fe2+/Mn2+ transporter
VTTFSAFCIVGLVPLSTFVINFLYPGLVSQPFHVTTILTGLTIFCLGAFKSWVTDVFWFRSGFEMFIIGGIAASVAYYVGFFLREIELSS